MRVVLGLLIYLLAVVAVGSGAAGVLSAMKESSPRTVGARPEPTPLASPRIQAWLERKAEGVAFAEKEKAAALAERERADALRAKLAAIPEPIVSPRTPDAEERRAGDRKRAARPRESARREARRRFPEVPPVYGYASEPRRSSYPDQLLTLRDRPSN
jgi:hypothetical protein